MINGTGKLKASSNERRKRFASFSTSEVFKTALFLSVNEACSNPHPRAVFLHNSWCVFFQDDGWPEFPHQRITLKTFIIHIQGEDILLLIATIFQSQTFLSFIYYVKLSVFGCITHCFRPFPFLDRNQDCCDNTVIMHMPCRAFWSLGNEG